MRVSVLRAMTVICGEVNVRVPFGPEVDVVTTYGMPSIVKVTCETPVSASLTTAETLYFELTEYAVFAAGVTETIVGLPVSADGVRDALWGVLRPCTSVTVAL